MSESNNLNLELKNNLRQVGKVISPHGLKGEIYIRVFSGDLSWFSKVKKLKVGDKEFSIKMFKHFKEGALLTLEGVSDRNGSDLLKGAAIWVAADIFKGVTNNEFYLTEIENFLVDDVAFGVIGPIIGFSSNGVQDLLQIKKNSGGIVEVPLIAEFIKEIDFANKQLHMILPEGLLSINDGSNEI
jgi:16S rRNA processing protein RimM